MKFFFLLTTLALDQATIKMIKNVISPILSDFPQFTTEMIEIDSNDCAERQE